MEKILNEDFEYILDKNKSLIQLEGKIILISGINGFIASYITKFLLYLNEKIFKEKVKIIGIARNKKKCKKIFSEYLGNKNLNFIFQDICEPIEISEKIDYILHCASQASPKYYSIDPVGTIDANVLGTRNLLKIAGNAEVKSFLFFSSSEVYGKLDNEDFPIKEIEIGKRDLTNIRNCYSESKSMGEMYCQSYFYQYNIPIKIIRIFHTYGPGLQRGDGRVFMDFIENILKNENIIMKSDGKAKRTFCYIADAVDAYFRVLLEGKNGEVYNIGNSYQEISVLDLAKSICVLSEKKIKIIEVNRKENDNYLKSEINRNIGDISKIESLGWKPEINILAGFYRTIKYMKEKTYFY